MVSHLPSSKTLVILGGVGARASALFHTRFVEKWVESHPCAEDSDFPNILHWSCGLKGLDAKGVSSPYLLKQALARQLGMLRQVVSLESPHTVVVAPCSSLTLQALEVSKAFPQFEIFTPLGVYWEEMPIESVPGKFEKPLFFCSASLRRTLEGLSMVFMDFPAESIQSELNTLIEQTIGSPDLEPLAISLKNLVSMQEGKETVFACTELSVLNSLRINPLAVDLMDYLVEAALSELLK